MRVYPKLAPPAALLRTQAELNRMLNVVQYALEQIPNHRTNGQLHDHVNGSNGNELDQEVLKIIYTSPGKRFTTSDVMVGMGTKAKEKRGAIKMALKRAVDAGFICLKEAGKGRKPSTYERLMEGLSK